VHRCPDVGLGDVDHEVGILRGLVWVVNPGEALDLTGTRLGVNTALVSLLGVLERCGNVDKEEGSVLLDCLLGSFSRVRKWRDGCNNRSRTGLGELCSNKSNASNVLVAVFSRESELGRQF
jgi:hypothetical protein